MEPAREGLHTGRGRQVERLARVQLDIRRADKSEIHHFLGEHPGQALVLLQNPPLWPSGRLLTSPWEPSSTWP